jgi:hypothetical protein
LGVKSLKEFFSLNGGGVVKRLLSLTLGFALLPALCGCGGKFFIRGAINTGTVSGTVSAVGLSIVSDSGAPVTVTLVTFLQSGMPNSMNFCGDQRTLFPLDQFVKATFTPTPACAIVQIVIG